MLYEVAQSRNLQDEWRVEAIGSLVLWSSGAASSNNDTMCHR